MLEPLNLGNLEWALTTLTELILLVYLVGRKHFRSHPVFSAYILIAILQSVLMAATYSIWGFQSRKAWLIFWLSEIAVTLVRFAAVMEVTRHILSPFSGVWALGRRVLLATTACVLVYTALLSREYWYKLPLNLDRGAGLAVAAVIVALLLFARYYGLPMENLDRSLCIGFCLYSCFSVINDSIFEKYLLSYLSFWNFLGVLTFLASLLIWVGAARAYPVKAPARDIAVVSMEEYRKLSTELNARLRRLNERLDHVPHSEDQHS
jgi:hypothetical protein